ncbi:unnamed protein product [Peronospora belbahrii]|uniref:Uncharacterized protein n=1 Tax=Peronospora belbahrii TaxID=622444 RepID=A0ABN8D2T2_9STRA|nr:unnamed protein product [Peronospora belbahrii]
MDPCVTWHIKEVVGQIVATAGRRSYIYHALRFGFAGKKSTRSTSGQQAASDVTFVVAELAIPLHTNAKSFAPLAARFVLVDAVDAIAVEAHSFAADRLFRGAPKHEQ